MTAGEVRCTGFTFGQTVKEGALGANWFAPQKTISPLQAYPALDCLFYSMTRDREPSGSRWAMNRRLPLIGGRETWKAEQVNKREIFRASLVTLAALAIVISDWPLGLSSDFASKHPVTAAVLGDLVIVLLAATVIETYLAHRSRVLRSRVFTVAQDDLANQYNLTRRLMLQLPGIECFDDRATRPLTSDASRKLTNLLSSHFAELPYSRDLDNLDARLTQVIGDPEWLAFANVQLQARQVEWRRVLAQWSPAMLPDGVLSEVLLTAASFNRRINYVQVPIIQFARIQSATLANKLEFVKVWHDFVDELILEMENISEFTSLNKEFDMGAKVVDPENSSQRPSPLHG